MSAIYLVNKDYYYNHNAACLFIYSDKAGYYVMLLTHTLSFILSFSCAPGK